MFGKFRNKSKVEVVAPMGAMEYEQERAMYKGNGEKLASIGEVAVGFGLSTVVGAGFVAWSGGRNSTVVAETSTVPVETSTVVPNTVDISSTVDNLQTVAVTANAGMVQTGLADSSMEMLGHILDPIVDIMVGFSFPIASVIMVGACFFFMIGRGERAWDIIFNCGIGFLLIQVAPMLLDILKDVGNVVK